MSLGPPAATARGWEASQPCGDHPALHSCEMPHGMRNGLGDFSSRKHLPVMDSGGFPGDVTVNVK